MASSKRSSDGSGPIMDAEWREVPEPAGSLALPVARPPPVSLRVRPLPGRGPARTAAPATGRGRCVVCGEPGTVTARVGPFKGPLCATHGGMAQIAAIVTKRFLGG